MLPMGCCNYELALLSHLSWVMWEASREVSPDGEVRGLRVPGVSERRKTTKEPEHFVHVPQS